MLIIVLIIIFFLCTIFVKEEIDNGPGGKNNNKGYPDKKDTISVILNKIEWSSIYNTRNNYFGRSIIWGLWLTFLLSCVLLEKLPNFYLFFKSWMACSLILMYLNGYCYWHYDKFRYYSILNGVEILRKKLKKKRNLNNLKSLNSFDIKPGGPIWNFTHQDYIKGTRHPSID